VSMDSDGDFVVAWSNYLGPHRGWDVLARRFDPSGKPVTDELQVNSSTSESDFLSAAALADDGRLVIVWTRAPPPSPFPFHGFEDSDVFAQRFTSDAAVLDIDSDGSVSAFSDGVLVMRFLFDFAGEALTNEAVAIGCTRCAPSTIEAHLGTLTDLDVDDDGDTAALTDGIVILRFLFGFDGDALTAGAVGSGCKRCDAAAIKPYLQGLI
jgi:hypothetical protein